MNNSIIYVAMWLALAVAFHSVSGCMSDMKEAQEITKRLEINSCM